MKLTTRSRYALRSMVELVNVPEGVAIPLAAIAGRQGITVKYLEQIFLKLHRAKLVKSKKGPGGGYMLARDPHRICLYDVLEAVGETTAPVLCATGKHDKYCSRNSLCPLQSHWKDLKKHIDSFFRSLTVADMCSRH